MILKIIFSYKNHLDQQNLFKGNQVVSYTGGLALILSV